MHPRLDAGKLISLFSLLQSNQCGIESGSPDRRVGSDARVGHGKILNGGYPQTADLHEDSDWKEIDIKSCVPKEATFIKITPILLFATGTLDIDDIRIDSLK